MRIRIHPGEILKTQIFEPMHISLTEGAKRLAITRAQLSRIVNGKAGISPDLAVRLEMAGISTAEFWNTLQGNYELSLARARKQPKVLPLEDAETRAARLKAAEEEMSEKAA